MRLVLIIFLLVCSVATSHAQQEVTFKGNKVAMSREETVLVADPVTGQQNTQVILPHPISINGKKIYPTDTLKVLPVIKQTTGGDGKKLSVYLFDNLKTKLDKLEDGNYILSVTNAVIDSKGQLVYYEFGGIQKLITKTIFIAKQPDESVKKRTADIESFTSDSSGNGYANIQPATTDTANAYSREETRETDMGIDPLQKETINTAAKDLLENMPKMIPAELNHIKVNCTGPVFSSWNYIIVKDHSAIFTPFYDCL